MTMIPPEGPGPGSSDDIGLLRAEQAILRAELAEVRDELAALDRGLIEAGRIADLALSRYQAVSRTLADFRAIAGLPADPDLRPARLVTGGGS